MTFIDLRVMFLKNRSWKLCSRGFEGKHEAVGLGIYGKET